jgi:hypothetical protein
VGGDHGPVRAAAWAPSGDRLALIANSGPAGLQKVVVVRTGTGDERPIFTATRLGDVAWSPAGRTLLVSWPHADQWLLLPTDARRRLTAISGLSRRFGGEPVLRGWCCSTRAER